MSNYLNRLAHLAFGRKRLVLAIWRLQPLPPRPWVRSSSTPWTAVDKSSIQTPRLRSRTAIDKLKSEGGSPQSRIRSYTPTR
jgi:hypothetical protein